MAKPRIQEKGKVSTKSGKPKSGKIEHFIGRLKGRSKKVVTIKEINEAAARGWAGQR
jgi:antitoxin PrlF